jgi:hypothetical protein
MTATATMASVAGQVLGKVEELMHVWDPVVDAVAENDVWRAALMDWRWTIVGAGIYVVIISLLRRLCAPGGPIGPLGLRWAVAAHNFVLCALSFVMATQTAYEGGRLWLGAGGRPFAEHFCEASRDGSLGIYGLEEAPPGRLLTGRVWVWCVVFYLSKYYELIDTILLAARGRPLAFLHVYHHIIIIPLVLAFIQAQIAYFWVGVVFNATIHTFMYYYYFMDSLGYKLWWKSHLTKAQIFQFCWGIFTWWPFPVVCGYAWNSLEAPMLVFWFNQAVLLSFLFLFVRFYLRTYSPAKGKAAHGKASTTGQKSRRKVE